MNDNASPRTTVMSHVNIGTVQQPSPDSFNILTRATHKVFSHNEVNYHYYREGNPDGPLLLTLHDIGQNPSIGFGRYFSHSATAPILKEFCVCHVALPGQCSDEQPLSSCPSFDEIAKGVAMLVSSMKKSLTVGMGIGAGANILIRACLLEEHLFYRLILINGYISAMGWGERISQKLHTFDLGSTQYTLTSSLISHLLDHFFGNIESDDYSYEYYEAYLKTITDSTNLRLLLNSFASRTPVNLIKPDNIREQGVIPNPKQSITFPVLLIVSGNSPQYDECDSLGESIDPSLIELIEFKEAHGFILNQYPDRVTHAIILFLQGIGYLRGVQKPTYDETITGLTFESLSDK